MNAFSLTIFEMSMLLHYATSADSPFRTNATHELVHQTEIKLARADLMERNGPNKVTAKGHVWIQRALSTPLPVQKWVWEE